VTENGTVSSFASSIDKDFCEDNWHLNLPSQFRFTTVFFRFITTTNEQVPSGHYLSFFIICFLRFFSASARNCRSSPSENTLFLFQKNLLVARLTSFRAACAALRRLRPRSRAGIREGRIPRLNLVRRLLRQRLHAARAFTNDYISARADYSALMLRPSPRSPPAR
jgi:hypothetical protein